MSPTIYGERALELVLRRRRTRTRRFVDVLARPEHYAEIVLRHPARISASVTRPKRACGS